MNSSRELQRFCDLAKDLGAIDAKIISTDQIVVQNWVQWKCRFGCPSYGKFLMCPPYSPKPRETRSLIEEYDNALLFRHSTSTPKTIAVELEKRIFLEDYPRALAFTSGSCNLCEECSLNEGHCLHPLEARPSMEACGISVFDTANNAGYDIAVLKSKNQSYLRYGLILIK